MYMQSSALMAVAAVDAACSAHLSAFVLVVASHQQCPHQVVLVVVVHLQQQQQQQQSIGQQRHDMMRPSVWTSKLRIGHALQQHLMMMMMMMMMINLLLIVMTSSQHSATQRPLPLHCIHLPLAQN
jgi:hypothetical protein